MRVVHLADLHLGYRQYQRLTSDGVNQREADVALAFSRAIDRVIEIAPDLVVVAGDVFHQVRPPNPAILTAFAGFARLTRELPRAIVVMVAGNHDTPRSRDTVCILRLFAQLGVHVVEGAPTTLRFPDRELAVTCVPDVPRVDVPVEPDPALRFNVLVAHAEVRGLIPDVPGRERAALVLEADEVLNPAWSYVALGHYHVHRQVGPRAWYSGAIEYTSSNPWGERREERAARQDGKGIVEHDLVSGAHRFHPVQGARGLVDLQPVDGLGMGATELDARIADAVARCPGGIDNRIVRLVLRNVPRHVARDLGHRALREFRRRALHFHLDVRPPESVRTEASGAPGKRATLADTLRDRLHARPLDAEIARDRFVALGLDYLARVGSVTAVPPVEGGGP